MNFLKLFFLILVTLSSCQKRKGGVPTSSSSEAAQPQGGETTEGGGGTDQLETYLIKKNTLLSSDLNLTPKQYVYDFAKRPHELFDSQQILRFYNIAEIMNVTQKEFQLRHLARKSLTGLLSNENVKHKDLIQKAHKLTMDSNVQFIWHLNLYDQNNRPAWSLNSPSKLRIRMNYEMWIGKKGLGERARLCSNILIPYYNLSPFYCYSVVDSIISTHEFLSLVGLEKDRDYHLSSTGL